MVARDNQMTRVLLVCGDAVGRRMAGPAIRAVELGRVLAAAGHDVTVATPDLADTEGLGVAVTTLSDATWLLGRSAMSPEGITFESTLPKRIAGVSPADIKRVAKQYLAKETIAVVLPVNENR